MPAQYVTTRHYLNIDGEKYISSREVMEEILCTWDRHLATLGGGFTTRISSQETWLSSVRGGMKLCIETTTRITCTDASLMKILRATQSSFRSLLSSSAKEVLTYSVWTICQELQSARQKDRSVMQAPNFDGLRSKLSQQS